VSNVKQLCGEYETGVLWATHLMDEVEDADYVYILHRGRVVSHGEVSELCNLHQQASVAELFRFLTEDAEKQQGETQKGESL